MVGSVRECFKKWVISLYFASTVGAYLEPQDWAFAPSKGGTFAVLFRVYSASSELLTSLAVTNSPHHRSDIDREFSQTRPCWPDRETSMYAHLIDSLAWEFTTVIVVMLVMISTINRYRMACRTSLNNWRDTCQASLQLPVGLRGNNDALGHLNLVCLEVYD